MYRVLIVDDEAYVVDWIGGLLENEVDEDIDVCRAYSAIDALSWLNRTKIDVIVTDICMPGISGLELLKKVHENWPKCKVIILSAHDNFEYVYDAIRQNITSYLLKTESDDVIIKHITEALYISERENANIELISEARKEIEKSLNNMQNECLNQMIKGLFNSRKEANERYNRLSIPFDAHKPYIIAIAKADIDENRNKIFANLDKEEILRQISLHYFSHNTEVKVLQISKTEFCFLMQEKTKEKRYFTFQDNIYTFIQGNFETIQKIYKKKTGDTLSILLYKNKISHEQCADVFLGLKNKIRYSDMGQTGYILTITEIKNDNDKVLSRISLLDEMPTMKEELKQNNKEEFVEDLNNLFHKMKSFESMQNPNFLRVYYTLSFLFTEYLSKKSYFEEPYTKKVIDKLMHIEKFESIDDTIEYFKNLTDSIFYRLDDDKKKQTDKLVNNIKNYVNENITKDVSLTKISELTGYNPSYISRVFSEHENITYIKYVNEVKINLAKKMLIETSYNVSEIAKKSGFQSRTYFNRFIKKSTGLSPKAYRMEKRK